MTTLTNQIRLQIAENSTGSLNFLALLRWALVIIFLWFGGMKFTAYEAAGIAPFIEHSPIMSWLHALFGVQGAPYVIGVIELSTAAALILRAFQPIFSALGAAMSTATYLITLMFDRPKVRELYLAMADLERQPHEPGAVLGGQLVRRPLQGLLGGPAPKVEANQAGGHETPQPHQSESPALKAAAAAAVAPVADAPGLTSTSPATT